MRYAFPSILIVAAIALILILWSHPPGSRSSFETAAPQSARSTPAQATPPAAQPAAAPARTAAPAKPPAKDVENKPGEGSGTTSPTSAPPAPSSPPQTNPPQADAKPSAVPAAIPAEATSGDVAAGRQVFRKCQACHSIEAGKELVGPSLAGIIGRKSGTEPNFNYSPAMKEANVTWSAETLDAYLRDPQAVVPGNRMPFPGLKSAHDRDDVIAFLAASAAKEQAGKAPSAAMPGMKHEAPAPSEQAAAGGQPITPEASHTMPNLSDVKYTLRTGIAEGRMVYLGVGGEIDGKVNPVLSAAEGQVVQITLINGEGAEHDLTLPDQNARSPRVTGKGASTTIAFRAGKAGDFIYFCSVPGHRLAGMEGKFIITPKPPAQTLAYADISREPTDLPPPLAKRGPQTVRVDLVTVELEGRLAEGTTFGYWTFNGKVPGPFIRVRVGDTIDVHLKNSADSAMIHSVDFHAATGPGGGAAALQVNPGDEKSMTFKALVPGLYVYHCATPMVAEHIANGMYGMILVEPENGLAKVDHEFYVMQGEIYTDQAFGQHGSQEFSVEKLLSEHPEYFVFNGSVGALTTLHPLHANVGETVRLFFGVGGPNFTSSFHVIGEIFDRVYDQGGVLSEPLRGIQTTTVAPGGATVVEFKLDVPGRYILVDHALARLERGLAGALIVDGPPQPEIYNGKVMAGGGH